MLNSSKKKKYLLFVHLFYKFKFTFILNIFEIKKKLFPTFIHLFLQFLLFEMETVKSVQCILLAYDN